MPLLVILPLFNRTDEANICMAKQRAPAVPSKLIQRMVGTSTRYEGHPLDLIRKSTDNVSDGQVVSFDFDLGGAPVPQRRYAAEACAVRERLGDLQLVFGQERLAGEGWDSALVVRMNPDAASRFLLSIERMSSPGLSAIAQKMSVKPQPLTSITAEPSQVVNVVANIASLAVSGYEACVDFYHASPFAMRQFQGGSSLSVEPVVRVDLRTAHLLSLVEAMTSMSKNWPKQREEQP